jgi:hypothetical protein
MTTHVKIRGRELKHLPSLKGVDTATEAVNDLANEYCEAYRIKHQSTGKQNIPFTRLSNSETVTTVRE